MKEESLPPWLWGQAFSSEKLRDFEIEELARTQFTPEADQPFSENDIMCCRKFTRCKLGMACRRQEMEQDFTDGMEYSVIVALEGELLHCT